MIVAGAAIVFLAIVLLVVGVSWREENPIAARMAALRGDVSGDYARVPQVESITVRVLGPVGQALVSKLSALLPVRWVHGIDRRLVQAGQPVTTGGFLIAVVFVEGTLVAFGFTMLIASGGTGGMGILMLFGTAVLGLFLPRVWLENRVRHRQKDILKSLPDAFDLVTTCVEAGLGLDAALARVAEKVEGPFAEELAISLKEVSLGKLRRDSLKELGERTGVPDLVSFINAVVQAETMGTSIATVLRVQADQMRVRRKQRAEQQAYKAPVKMIFPLVLCIFPTLFIVILGPAGITLYEQFVSKAK
jgi:tight adherence protein C